MERDESNNKNYFITKEHGTAHKTVKVSMKKSIVNSAEEDETLQTHQRIKVSRYWHKSIIDTFLGLVTLSVIFCPFFSFILLH